MDKLTPDSQLTKRSHSMNRPVKRKSPSKKLGNERRCRSWSSSPSDRLSRTPASLTPMEGSAAPDSLSKTTLQSTLDGAVTKQEEAGETESSPSVCAEPQNHQNLTEAEGKSVPLPHCVMAKISRLLSVKKRDFARLRKHFITQQNMFLESYAQLREVETRAGIGSDDITGDVKVVTLNGWPASDILLLTGDWPENKIDDLSSVCGSYIINKATSEFQCITDDVKMLCTELMSRRNELINSIKSKHHLDKIYASGILGDLFILAPTSNTPQSNTKSVKVIQLEEETKDLYKMIEKALERIRVKTDYIQEMMKTPWLDRDKLNKKIEKLQKDNLTLQTKIESYAAKEALEGVPEAPDKKVLAEELAKERSAREALKELVMTAEGMLRSARGRISTMERQAKEIKAELEQTKKKHKEMEQLVIKLTQYRQRESNYDARSKKMMELSKSGEQTIETLSRQRDALEIRVKDLLDQVDKAEHGMSMLEAEQRSRINSLQAKVAEQEKQRTCAETRVKELEANVKELVTHLDTIKQRSNALMDLDRYRYLGFTPSKEVTPGEREVEIYKELQSTRLALSRTQDELRKSRADKEAFLNSLARIANTEDDSDQVQKQIGTELINKEKEIAKLRNTIEEHLENEKFMEQDIAKYENQLAALRLEVKRLRNYDWYAKDLPHRELQTELLELQMKVETMTCERTALESAVISRALMLERHERATDFFTRMIRAKRDLVASFNPQQISSTEKMAKPIEVTKSLSLVCSGVANTWTSLRVEREHVRRLEQIVMAQSAQLEKYSEARIILEDQRTKLERMVLRRNCDQERDVGGVSYCASEDLSRRSVKSNYLE